MSVKGKKMSFLTGEERDLIRKRTAELFTKRMFAKNNTKAAKTLKRARTQAHVEAWRKRNPERLRASQLRRLYGLSMDAYVALVAEQGNRCGICAGELAEKPRPHVDHCHATGQVRGILCSGCNNKLGWFEAYSLGIEDYLTKAAQRRQATGQQTDAA